MVYAEDKRGGNNDCWSKGAFHLYCLVFLCQIPRPLPVLKTCSSSKATAYWGWNSSQFAKDSVLPTATIVSPALTGTELCDSEFLKKKIK